MKNRIWKKILAVGVSLLAEAGMLVGCTAQPAVAYGAEMEGGLSVVQDAAWTDLQKFQAVISVKADGLASLTWENENQEYESGDENLFRISRTIKSSKTTPVTPTRRKVRPAKMPNAAPLFSQ